MTQGILPVVGSAGFYNLASPFDVAAEHNVEYTCIALRRISDYLANNEDVKKDVYDKHQLPSDIWDEAIATDTYIVSLRSSSGHMLYVPSRYILSYPSVNGVPYRTVMIGISLPPMPADQDLAAVLTEVKDSVDTLLGVSSVVKTVETSKVTLVQHERHLENQQKRAALTNGRSTTYARLLSSEKENAKLRDKVAELEAYIKAHYVP